MNKNEALKLLTDTRIKIDQIDDEIIELIVNRTSLAVDIATAKIVLGKDIHDKSREDYIQNKIMSIAKKKNIDETNLMEIMNILTNLNKTEQKKKFNGR